MSPSGVHRLVSEKWQEVPPGALASDVLGKATLRAASGLGLSRRELAAALGVSEASLSRIAGGVRGLDPESKAGELGLFLVRLFRSLDALVGGDEEARQAWMRARNRHLEEVPATEILTIRGLVRVVEYLDALRG